MGALAAFAACRRQRTASHPAFLRARAPCFLACCLFTWRLHGHPRTSPSGICHIRFPACSLLPARPPLICIHQLFVSLNHFDHTPPCAWASLRCMTSASLPHPLHDVCIVAATLVVGRSARHHRRRITTATTTAGTTVCISVRMIHMQYNTPRPLQYPYLAQCLNIVRCCERRPLQVPWNAWLSQACRLVTGAMALARKFIFSVRPSACGSIMMLGGACPTPDSVQEPRVCLAAGAAARQQRGGFELNRCNDCQCLLVPAQSFHG